MIKKALALLTTACMVFNVGMVTFAENPNGDLRNSGSGALGALTISDIADQTLTMGSNPATAEVTVTVLDSGNAAVADATIEAISNGAGVATVSVSGQKVTITAVKEGNTTISVTANKEPYTEGTATINVTVNPATGTGTALTGVTISGTAKVGEQLSATVAPAAATATYKWQISDTANGTYSDISGATTANYTPVAGDVEKFIKVVATGTGNFKDTVTSTATAAVAAKDATISETPKFTTDLAAKQTLTVDSPLTLTVAATVGDNGNLSYQWYKGDTEIVGATVDTYTIAKVAMADAGSYKVIVTNTKTGFTPATATSTICEVTVNEKDPGKSSANAITSFKIGTAVGTIDEAGKTIAVTLPSGKDVTKLAPSITISEKATVSPANGIAQDFTNFVNYTVTAEDESIAVYKVTVKLSEKPMFTVNFNTNGGTDIGSQSVVEGGVATKPTDNPTRTGYTFKNWFSNKECTSAFNFADPITKSTTVYAGWDIVKAIEYTVTFYTNGGSIVPAKTVVSGSLVQKPAAPTKSGYTFVDWIGEDGAAFNFVTTKITKDTRLEAKWVSDKAKTFEVTFNTDGGSSISRQTVAEGTSALKPANPTKPHYEFDGEWYTDKDKTTRFSFNTEITKDITLYAKWILKDYEVTYNDGGTTSGVHAQANTNITLPAPKTASSDKPFAGWFTAEKAGLSVGMNGASYKVTKSITLYAQYTKSESSIKNSVDAIKDLGEGSSNKAIADAVKEIADTSAGALANNSTVKNNLGDIDKQLKAALGVETKLDVSQVNGDAKAVAEQIKFEGATLSLDLGTEADVNAARDTTVSLAVTGANTSEEDVKQAIMAEFAESAANPDAVKVSNLVALEISLDVGGKATDLKAPLKLQVPYPTGANTSKVQVIHFSSHGTEFITPKNENGLATFHVTSLSPFAFAEVEYPKNSSNNETPSGGGNHGGGGGGGGGSASSGMVKGFITPSNPATSYNTITPAAAASAASKAVAQAVGANSANATVTLQNVKIVDAKVFQAINDAAVKAAKGAQVKVTVHLDTVVNGKVTARLYVDPVAAAMQAAPIGTAVDTAANSAVNASIYNMFSKYFSNQVSVVTFSQKSAFNMPVSVAVKTDLSKLNTNALRFYSYNVSANAYTAIAQPAYFIDTAGYVHFNTTLGGSVVITDKVLTAK